MKKEQKEGPMLKKLRASENKYGGIYNVASLAFVVWDTNTKVIDWNKKAEEIFGWKREDIIGKNFFDYLIPREEKAHIKEITRELLSGKITSYSINKNITKSGKIIICEWNNTILRDEGGNIIGAISLASDITERKKAEEDLKIKNIIFDKSEASNSISDSKGIITEVNESFLRLTGFSNKKEVIGKPVSHFFNDGKDAKILMSALHKKRVWSGEIVAKKKDGSKIVLFGSATTLKNEKGEVIGYQSSMYDITEQKKAEDELKKAKEDVEKQVEERTRELNKQKMFFSSILENVPDMIFVKDAKDLKFELFNKAGEELLGYKREQLIGKSDYDFFPKEQADFFIQKDRSVLKSKELLDIPEEPINTKSGKRFLHTKKIPIMDDGKPLYLMGISEDITQRKKTETEYGAILENMLDGLAILDMKGNVLETNDSYCKMLKYSKEDLLKLNLDFIDVRNDSKKINERLQEILVVGSGKFETQHKRKDGVIIDVEMSITYLESSNKFFAFIHDITERKKNERELIDRAGELERFNRAAVGRELKMVELKKKIKQLEGGKN